MLPSTPLGGESWQIFGATGGRLAPFGKPFSTSGQLISAAEPLVFRVWTGNFFVIVPLEVDWASGKVRPPPGRCPFQFEVERRPAGEAATINLAPKAGATKGERVIVKTESRVEFLTAEAEVVWDEGTEVIDFGAQDVWLKVRVAGKEGWVHSEEDFHAVGLPTAG